MQQSNVWLASRLINHRVRNSAGEDLGKIEDFVVDPETGRIEYAVLSFGGLLGMGDKLVSIPWSVLGMSSSGDYVLLDMDKESLRRAPSFDRDDWPNMTDPRWRRSLDDHYERGRTVVRERPVYVDRSLPARRGLSVLGAILLICFVLALGWLTYLVSTRGWDQAKQDIRTSLQSAAYAAKETSQSATLTTKVKTALSLSKRTPTDKINVDSEGDVVTLRGEVPSQEIRDRVEAIVRDVPGVSEVHNNLFVTQSQ